MHTKCEEKCPIYKEYAFSIMEYFSVLCISSRVDKREEERECPTPYCRVQALFEEYIQKSICVILHTECTYLPTKLMSWFGNHSIQPPPVAQHCKDGAVVTHLDAVTIVTVLLSYAPINNTPHYPHPCAIQGN